MRPGQQHQQKRMRGRNNNRGKGGGNQHNRSFESNGPDVKIRGTAAHIADKYVQLARDAQSAGDPVAAENYLQHAEHYYRIVAASQPQYPQNQGQPQGFQRADDEDLDDDTEGSANGFDPNQQGDNRPQQNYQQNAPQNYEQRDNREHQPREHRHQHNNNDGGGGLPAFITGGGEQGQDRGDRGDRDFRNNRGRNRRFGRYGRNGGPGEQGAPEGNAPGGAEPEVAPGE